MIRIHGYHNQNTPIGPFRTPDDFAIEAVRLDNQLLASLLRGAVGARETYIFWLIRLKRIVQLSCEIYDRKTCISKGFR